MKGYWIFIVLVLFHCSSQLQAQNAEVDSLEILLSNLPEDTNRVRVLGQLISKVRRFDIKRALQYADEGFPLAQKLNDENAVCKYHLQYTMMYLGLGKNEEAIKWSMDGIDYCSEIGRHKQVATLYFLASNLYLTAGKIERSEEMAKNSIEASEQADYTYGKILGFKAIGDIAETKGDLQSALSNYQAGMSIAKENNIVTQEMVLNNNLGIIYDELGWREKALEHYIAAANIAEAKNEQNGLMNFLANIADIYGTQGEHQKALDISMRALGIAEKSSNQRALPELFVQIGNYNGRLGYPEKEEEYYIRSRDISKELKNQRALSFSYDNLGKLLEKRGELQQAESLYLQCLAIREEINYKGGLTRIHNSLGNFYLNQGKTEKALSHFLRAKDISEEMSFVEQMNKNYKGLAESFAAAGKYKDAYQYQSLHIATKDTLWNEDRNKQIARMETQFEVKEKEANIDLLENEAVLMAATREKDQLIKYLLVGVALLLAGLGYMFFNRSKILRSKNEMIEKTSQELAGSLTEKETLLKEIHHRVKNNLQIISSLLNLQTRQITDDSTLATIKEGQSRVQAMSLIHQKLYQSDQLSKVDIENYLEELTLNLAQMFEDEGKSIAVKVDASNIEFDIDTAIPLGLIVNELVSNAYKYAFEGRDQGNIRIAIKALTDNNYELKVEDDGKGFPIGFESEKSKSLGLRLVKILSEQLRGSVNSVSNEGTIFTIRFKDIRAFQQAA